MKYDIDYFINKFEAIPENEWCTATYEKENSETGVIQHCALGHCNEDEHNQTDESKALIKLLNYFDVIQINDDQQERQYKGSTPKKRILNVLKALKEGSK